MYYVFTSNTKKMKATLKETLEVLINKHTLAEVLDRITDLAHEQCSKSENDCTSCKELVAILEQATQCALNHPDD